MRFQLVRRGVWFIEVYYHLGMSEIPTGRKECLAYRGLLSLRYE